MFGEYVYITTSDKLENFDLIFSYRDYMIPLNSYRYLSKLSVGYTLRNESITKEYFDNLDRLRFNDIFLPENFVLPKTKFLEQYGYYELDKNVKLIISNKNNIQNNKDINIYEAIMLILPPKKFISKYIGGNLIFKLKNKEIRLDITQFSYDFFTIIIFDKIDVIFESTNLDYMYIFKTTIKYNENMLIEI